MVASHSVTLIGYDDSKQLLKFINSWGPGWGDKGFGYISYMAMPFLAALPSPSRFSMQLWAKPRSYGRLGTCLQVASRGHIRIAGCASRLF
jgi:C1A family cysteine protease